MPTVGGDPKDLSADADERPATSPPIELRRIVTAPNAAAPQLQQPPNHNAPMVHVNVNAVGVGAVGGGGVVVAPSNSSNNVAMRSAAGANVVPHSLQSPQDQRATGKRIDTGKCMKSIDEWQLAMNLV